MDSALMALAGAPASRAFRKIPLTTQVFFSGLVTQRSPFSSMDNRANRIYLHGRPDQLIDGLNVELTNSGTYIRRPGTSFFFPGSVAETNINTFYSFHQLNGNILTMMDGASSIWTISPTAGATSVFTKSVNAGQSYFQTVGNTLYIGDGIDQVAWDGVNPFRNWGIVAPQPTGSTALYAGSGADGGGAGSIWANPSNVVGAPNNTFATTTTVAPPRHAPQITTRGISNNLNATNYGFSVSSGAVISGVQLDLTGFTIYNTTGNLTGRISVNVQLISGGSIIGSSKTVVLSGVNSTVTVGGSSDTWGASLTSSLVNLSSFGVAIQLVVTNSAGVSASFTGSMDAAHLTVFELGAPIATVSSSAGTFSAVNGGYQYVYAYGNGASGHVSNPTLASATTGNFSNKLNVSLPVVASTDPQVNQIRVFRTKDGGNVFFELPTSPYPNTTTTILDSAPDSSLNNEVFWPAIPYVLNTPPPSGLGKMAYHMGRIWGAVGNFVFYSANGDVALGNGNESFPPANFFQFPTTVNRLVPYSSGLLVFTADDVWIIYGTSVATFYPMPFQQGVGLLNYNALDIQGSNIFLYTTDRQMLSLSSSGINEIGYAIGDILQNNFDPALVHVDSIIAGTAEKAVYISDGSQTWFRCNWNQPPEGGPAWSPKAVIGGGCNALTTVETSPGVHQLLMAYSTGGVSFVLFRDVTVFTDAATGGPYSDAFLTLGSLVMAQPGQIAEIDNIILELKNLGSIPSLSILTDEISGPFESLPVPVDDPPTLVPSATVMSKRWYLAQGANAARLRHMQIKIDYNQDTVRNELLTLSVFGGLIHEN